MTAQLRSSVVALLVVAALGVGPTAGVGVASRAGAVSAAPASTASASTAASTAAPAIRTVMVRSFDGTGIVTHFFPAVGLAPGRRAPGVLVGPGWSLPGETDPNGGSVGPLRTAGFNVVTWDPRGFGGSGGQAQVDYAPIDGRDVGAVISWLARQPEAALERPGDPRVGMTGASYGGGIQFVTAAIDRRVDVIVPTIAWNSLLTSLDPRDVYKAGWGQLLCAIGMSGTNRVDPHVASSCRSGAAGAAPSDEDRAWFAARGPGFLLSLIRVPTMIVQGTVDTLFTLPEGIANYRILRRTGVPLKMVWFCGGHGTCLTNPGRAGYVQQLTLAWLDRYLNGDRHRATGPGFEYVDDTGTWRGSHDYPLAPAGTLAGAGSGPLSISPADTSGTDVAAGPAGNALSVPVGAPSRPAEVVGAPRLELRYTGRAAPVDTPLYAQLVDTATGLVVGNQATPIPVRLDGRPRRVGVRLVDVAVRVTPSSRLVLQLTAGTRLYTPQKATGSVMLAARVALPLVHSGTTLALP